MRQFISIAVNAFMELVRQPIFLLLVTSSAAFIVFLSNVPYFGFGEEYRMVEDSALAVMLLTGLLGAVLSASNSLTREIHAGTALAVLSKPVGRATFLLGKFCGVSAALVVLNYVNTVATLLASRMAYDAYNDIDTRALVVFGGFLVAAYAAAGFSNYFLRRPFVPDALLALVIAITVAFVVIYLKPRPAIWRGDITNVNWRLLPACGLILLALWVLAALAMLCSTRLELIATLAVCSAFFLVGLVSDYLFGQRAAQGSWWASVVYTVLPNWQLFWMSDVLGEGREIPLSYLTRAVGYTAAYVGAALAVALALFEERELS
jgi:hypothetical protein